MALLPRALASLLPAQQMARQGGRVVLYQARPRFFTAIAKTEGPAGSSSSSSSPPPPADLNSIYLGFWDKVLLVSTLKVAPWNIPQYAGFGTMNSAWGRMKIFIATSAMILMLIYSEEAIKQGRAARDGGDKCLYDDPVAQRVQQEKRARAQLLAERQAAAEAAAAAAAAAPAEAPMDA
eukprot:m.121803 g.121803  ORF g.121803 m.121803 type:complete len:179 (+) comp14585_c7_seq2:1075-1611(+)